MLVATKSQNAQYPVGIAVAQWQIKGELRTYVLYPIRHGSDMLVELDVLIGEAEIEPLQKKPANWVSLGDTFGDQSSGYSVDESIAEALYKVWDDGAATRKAQAAHLYDAYQQQIQNAEGEASKYLEKLSEENYEIELKQAEASGWDTSGLSKQEYSFPFST